MDPLPRGGLHLHTTLAGFPRPQHDIKFHKKWREKNIFFENVSHTGVIATKFSHMAVNGKERFFFVTTTAILLCTHCTGSIAVGLGREKTAEGDQKTPSHLSFF